MDATRHPAPFPGRGAFSSQMFCYTKTKHYLCVANNLDSMEQPKRFDVIYLKEAADFIDSLDVKIRAKILYNISLAKGRIDPELFKKLNDSIWKFRTQYNGMTYHLFAFWNKQRKAMVIATHGLIKKTQKTPAKEINRAEEIMRKY